MGAGFNQAVILGRLAASAEMLTSKSGKQYVQATIAVTVYWQVEDGKGEERTSFITVTIFGRQAEDRATREEH